MQAYLVSASNGTLRFLYEVREGDSSADLDYVSAGALLLNGGNTRGGMRARHVVVVFLIRWRDLDCTGII